MADNEQQAANQEQAADRARVPFRLLAWAVGIIAALVILAIGAVLFVVFARPDLLAPALARAIEPLGYEARYQGLRVSMHPPALYVENLTLSSKNMPGASGPTPQEFAIQAVIPTAELVLDLARGWESGVWVDILRVENPAVTVFVPASPKDAEPGGMALAVPAVFRELHVSGGVVTAHLPQGVMFARDVAAHIDEGEQALERTFKASAHAGFEFAGDATRLALDANVSGAISPQGAISVAVDMDQGRLDGQQAASFQGSARVRVEGGSLDFEDVRLGLRDVRAQMPNNALWEASDISLAVEGAALHGAEDLTLKGAASGARGVAVTLQDGRSIGLESISLIIPDGSFTLPGAGFTLAGLSMDASRLVRFTGDAAYGPDGLALDAQGVLESLEQVLAKAGPFLPQSVRNVSAAGELPFSLALAGSPDALRIEAEVAPRDVRFRLANPALDARVSGSAAASGPLNGPLALSGEIDARGDFVQDGVAVRNARVRATLGGVAKAPVLGRIDAWLAADGLKVAGESPPLGALAVSAQRAALDENRLEVRGLKATTERLGEFRGWLSVDLENPGIFKAELSARRLDAAAVYAVAQDAGLTIEGLADLTGAFDLKASVGPSDTGLLVATDAAFSGLSFTAAQGAVLAGELSGSITARIGLGEPRPVQAAVSLVSGEALLDTCYLNFGSYRTELDASCTMHGPRDFRDAAASLAIEDIGEARLASARFADKGGVPEFSGRLEIQDPNIATALQVFVKEPLSFSRPDLSELAVDGRAAFVCDVSGQGEAVDVSGLLTLDGLGFDYPAQGVAAQGLGLRLPFAYRLGAGVKAPAREMVAEWGRLSWSTMVLPTGTLPAGTLDLALVKNALFTRGRLPLPLPGGEASLGPVRVDEPLSPEHVRLETSAVLERLDLSALPTEAVSLTGNLSGAFPDIVATSDRLMAKGEVKGEFFGGELAASGFSVLRPFSAGRVLGVDALTITGIELEPLSLALDIGRITGILDIDVRNYRQAFGQPVALELTASSRKVRSVSQRVSLKAVNAISVMGTGSGLGDVGVGMFAGFFEEFGYDAIGISSSLKNDVFRVRGLIRQGGVEYLIKKPLLFGINVINRNPDNQISFSDMMERVQRVVGGEKDQETQRPKEES